MGRRAEGRIMFREVDDHDDLHRGHVNTPYARFDRRQLEVLARAMPDAQSAVLLCLAWHAARQARLHRGEYAGQFVARVSARELAELIDRAIRTVRYALKALKQNGLIDSENRGPGKKGAFRVTMLETGTDEGISPGMEGE